MTPGVRLSPEGERLTREYERRDREIPPGLYSMLDDGALFLVQHRDRDVLRALRSVGWTSLKSARILDVGCGKGDWLVDFVRWGADPSGLSGIDISESRIGMARKRICSHPGDGGMGAELRVGEATSLEWKDETFDIVVLGTVMSSILDPSVRSEVAAEIRRVVRPGGIVLWYDFFVNNPWNRNVRGMGRSEIGRLFPDFEIRLRRSTLAPPLARKVARLSWLAAEGLAALKFLDTHYVGTLRKVATKSG